MDIQEWAGSKILSRGKSYQRSGSVEDLAISKKNQLVAWVEGSARYATMVSFKRGSLSSSCTCPYGTNCKHGVAVVVEYLEMLKKKTAIPIIAAKDKRLTLIKEGKTTWPDEADDNWDDEYESDLEDDDDVPQKTKKNKSSDPVDEYLKGKSREELLAIVKNIAASNSDVGLELSFKAKLSSPSVTALVKTVSKEIDKATSEPGWSNHWNHSGYTPDYSRAQEGLQKLSDAGKYDEIVTLGKKLYTKGMEQAGQSDDEGETIQEICDALSIVFDALKKCSLADVDKMEQAIDWEMADEYSMADGLEVFWKKKFSKGDWSTIADRLLLRFKNYTPENDKSEFSRDYHRDKLTNHIINALGHAGRSAEKLDLCIREAPITKSYDRLVNVLRASGKTGDAEEWIRKGIRATQNNLSGIASGLRKQLLEIYSEKRDWPFCAAIKADEFFESPSLSGYKDLKQACTKAKLWEQVRPATISFLTNGIRPKAGSAQWPLPETGIASSSTRGHSKPPYTTELTEVALFEKDIDEALRLYDENERTRKNHSSWGYGWGSSIIDQIADAVKEKYPERSIGIWKKTAENHIDRTSPKEYAVALGYLNRISRVMKKIGKDKEFKNYIASIREQNKRKIRLVEMLDGLSGKRIIDE
jgi:uncharacterized Zn finger protein